MKTIARFDRTLVTALLVTGGLFSATPALAVSRDAAALKRALGAGVRVAEHHETGKVRFVGTAAGKPIARARGLSRSASPSRAARAFFGRYGAAFGIRDQASELRVSGTEAGTGGRSAVRFQQLHAGVPVLGGELVVNLDAARNVLSASGEALPDADVATSPRVGSTAAREAAIAAVAKTHGVPAVRLDGTLPELWIYDSRILGGPGLGRPVLVWRLDVKGDDALPINELVLIDAARGFVALRINQIESALQRTVCDANDTSTNIPCDAPVRSEGDPPHSVADVNGAYDFAGVTYNFFLTNFGRDSLDGQGLPLKSTVRYCDPDPLEDCPNFPNAFWNGQQMAYGTGYASADDVVGHELTHGVTEFTANLFYYYQSGAINESLSDVFGEFVDLTNVTAADTAATRWKLGEDLPIGAIRDMEDPTIAPFNDPDRMTSLNYYPTPTDNGELDNGGVHSNSGVNNKAAFLMTDGGTFNGHTIAALGITKVARIYYTVQSTLLTSGSDYSDLGSALPQACTNLIGTVGITSADCAQVAEAVAAVEMNTVPPAAPTREAPTCPSGFLATNLFSDNLENPASGNWTRQSSWIYDAGYATSGIGLLFGANSLTAGTNSVTLNPNVAIPAGSSAFLRFNHAYGFEDNSFGTPFDGGVLEYSVNNGASFADIGSLLTDGGYTGTISTASDNPLEGRAAFTNESNGYGSSRATLSSLGGQSVRFRFRIATDTANGGFGWVIDDVRIYTCAAPPPPPPPPPVVVTPPIVTPADTLSNATVRSCRRTGRARRTRVICNLTRFGAVSRVTVRVTRRGRTVASGSAKPSGTGTLTIKGKRTLRRGTYRVTLTLRAADGTTRKLTKTLRVR